MVASEVEDNVDVGISSGRVLQNLVVVWTKIFPILASQCTSSPFITILFKWKCVIRTTKIGLHSRLIVRHWSHRHWSHQTLITPDIDHTVCKIGHWSHQTLITPDIDHTGHWSHQTLITLCVKKDIDHTRHWSHRVWNRTLITPDIDHIRHWSHYV